MITINIEKIAGDFGENKDVARSIRVDYIIPSLERGDKVELDFAGVSGVTQSFVHALIADPLRDYPDSFFELVLFKNCTDLVKTIIEMVSEYLQESE